MAENGGISQKDIDRTYTYFDQQTPEEKRKILDKFIEQRKRGGQAGIEFKDITTLKELCKQYSSDLYSGSDEARELAMVEDIYKALNELFEKAKRKGNTRTYVNLAGSRTASAGAGAKGESLLGAPIIHNYANKMLTGEKKGGYKRKTRRRNKNKKSRRH
jgi:hypothetical protein